MRKLNIYTFHRNIPSHRFDAHNTNELKKLLSSRYKNPELLADKIIQRYNEVIDDDVLLNEISKNAREWYLENISGPNITNKIINILGL